MKGREEPAWPKRVWIVYRGGKTGGEKPTGGVTGDGKNCYYGHDCPMYGGEQNRGRRERGRGVYDKREREGKEGVGEERKG